MGISTQYQEVVLNRLASDVSHVSLHTAAPGSRGANELVWDAYERQVVRFNPAVGGTITNSNAMIYDEMPVVTITHFGLWDAEVGGKFIFGAMLLLQDPDDEKAEATSARVEHEGDILKVPAESMEVSID